MIDQIFHVFLITYIVLYAGLIGLIASTFIIPYSHVVYFLKMFHISCTFSYAVYCQCFVLGLFVFVMYRAYTTYIY